MFTVSTVCCLIKGLNSMLLNVIKNSRRRLKLNSTFPELNTHFLTQCSVGLNPLILCERLSTGLAGRPERFSICV